MSKVLTQISKCETQMIDCHSNLNKKVVKIIWARKPEKENKKVRQPNEWERKREKEYTKWVNGQTSGKMCAEREEEREKEWVRRREEEKEAKVN